ncbi:acetyl/propionyl/methylcrotonyl-CoA carboxylase subunit alpha [Stenotrophomonas sp. CFBP 13725]|uniref:acetyl-CoA carboxylase biotin carboxylase subunit n=1 Tax=Stenotrophomonas sp. CFBP 13725 TaxID=2775297 RepID=UPI0017848292|nr:acetyl/propionyl/methylcrotonyl-CoA carboxylase subunit alpha [Stenotrophomonas sp. CFBP 13725]MBD8637489.1 acetyl/propionyl/methylcrotonyl-CoA carboxylase subunit alpha [Stenotrophomonas sp. CFBP 13725]
MFNKILIANRGEIACRVIATCRALGIATVAVYSDADRNARHVRLADEAVAIGPAPAAESYLRAEVILDAARRTGAQAIHPGYGFLSENAAFADACAAAGIVFIGPPASAIRAMGDKSAAKALMQQAGVPLTPGYHGDNQDPQFLRGQADAIGYPVLIKASAGGGGKGMRRVDDSAAFIDALASCQREARSAFGNEHVLVEKYVLRPRHIEIQVFGDRHGNVVHLFERDCSVQRRHQKVLEEAPAPGMTAERRAAMGKAAVDAARAVGYVGAGTVEFIASPDGDFYFMEMNTRLQVEHPVTEFITGTDLVAWQLQVAAGQPLPKRQDELAIHGHALEARLYAEDADKGFLPSIGTLRHLRLPTPTANVRVDTGVEEGDTITPFYDPMIAKLIVWDINRDAALRRMQQALADCQVVGVTTNAGFLRRLVGTASFSQAKLDTALIEREQEALAAPAAGDESLWALAAIAAAVTTPTARVDARDAQSPWQAQDGWRIGETAARTLPLQQGEREHVVRVTVQPGGWQVRRDAEPAVTVQGSFNDGHLEVVVQEQRLRVGVQRDGVQVYLFTAQGQQRFTVHDPVGESEQASADAGSLLAPMPGKIVATLVEPGSKVTRGTPLVVLEAMKMEHTLAAPADGTVHGYRAKAGEQVGDGAVLVDFEAA